MENTFSRKIDFHVTFLIIWCKINYFLRKKEKCELNYLRAKNINQMVAAEIDTDQMNEC